MDTNNIFNESKLIIFIYSDKVKCITLAKNYVKSLQYLGAPTVYIDDIFNTELDNTTPQWSVCVKQDLNLCSESIVADEVFYIYDEETSIKQEQPSNCIEVKVLENYDIQDILTQVLRKSSLAKTASEIWKKNHPPITSMDKVVEKIVKEDPFVTSVTSHKTDCSTKCIFDCDTSIEILCNVNGVDTLAPYSYKYMMDATVEDNECFKIESSPIMIFKEVAEYLSNFRFGAKEVIFDYNKDTLEYRESLGISKSDPRHFVLVNFKTETFKILSTPYMNKEEKASYLIPMDITGLYNTDGTPNREAGYFKIEESEVES